MLPRFDAIRINAKKLDKDAETKFEKNQQEAFTLYTKAVTQLQDIPEKDRAADDWRKLAKYQNHAGIACQDPHQRLTWYETAIQSLLYIPEKERTRNVWSDLAKNQYNVGARYMELSQWKRAQSYFYSALDTLNNAIDNKLTAKIYYALQKMETQYSINKQLYSFAHDVFSGKNQPDVKTQFLQLHLAVMNTVDSQPNSSRRGLLQLMLLIKSGVKASHYPNEDVKKWLSNKDDHEKFERLLQEAENANQPLSLLKAIDQAPTFSVAVASKLLMLDEVVSTLKEEIQNLKKENEQLKKLSFFQPKNNNHHQDQTVQEALSGQNMEKTSEKNNVSPSFTH